jgi:hypothetical protein
MIAGRVVDAGSQAPVAGARVAIFRIVEVPHGAFGEDQQHALTNSTGEFAFRVSKPGRYRIDVEKSGFAPSLDPFDAKTFDLGEGQSISGLQIALERGAVVAGGVRDRQGEPLPEMMVCAMRRVPAARRMGMETIQSGTGQTNDLGEFRIANLPAGEYLIVAVHQPRSAFGPSLPSGVDAAAAPTYYPGTTDRRTAHIISVGIGKTVAGLWFPIVSVPAFTVSGIVVDRAGAPVSRAMVTLMSSAFLEIFPGPMMMMADEDGAFQIGGVIAGTYHVSATSGDWHGSGSFSVVQEVTVAGSVDSDPVVVSERPSQPSSKVTVVDADVTGVRVVAAAIG